MPPAVLLIDDNAVQASTRQAILKRAGYFVIAVLNPQRALEQLQSNEFPQEIGLVITDHYMPRMTGSEFVRILRTFSPHLPVMVLSGMAEAFLEYQDMDVCFRVKPLQPENLLIDVQDLLALQNPVR